MTFKCNRNTNFKDWKTSFTSPLKQSNDLLVFISATWWLKQMEPRHADKIPDITDSKQYAA